MITQFNGDELDALYGLPLAARVLYLTAIRPYMDYESGIVGINRRISLRGLMETLYVDPHQGMKGQTYSRDQVYRLVGWLEKTGLVERRSIEREKLIFFLPLADRGFQVKKKAATKPRQSRDSKAATDEASNQAVLDMFDETDQLQPKYEKAATPQITVNSNKKDTTKVVSKKTPISVDFCVTQRVTDWYKKNAYQEPIENHLANFILACQSGGYKYVDWDAAFQKAIRDDWAKARTQKSLGDRTSQNQGLNQTLQGNYDTNRNPNQPSGGNGKKLTALESLELDCQIAEQLDNQRAGDKARPIN
jgi:hypothetical protein